MYVCMYVCMHACMYVCMYLCMVFMYACIYRIHGLFGSDFNLAVWQMFIGSPNLNHTIFNCMDRFIVSRNTWHGIVYVLQTARKARQKKFIVIKNRS